MENILSLDFQLLGTKMPPKQISTITGIVPDIALLRGERNKEKDLPRQNIWSIRSNIESDQIIDHWLYLSKRIESSMDEIKIIAMGGICRISIIISGERIPSIKIPPSMARFAGYVNAEIDIDHIQN